MFTWNKLYNSVPYESVVKGITVNTRGPRPEFCEDKVKSKAEEAVRPDEQETGHGR